MLVFSPVLFLLAAVAQTPAPASVQPATAPGAKPAKLKCVSREVTGSLAQRIRECHTPEEWDRLRTRTQEDAAKVIDNHVTSCGQTTLGGC